MRIIDAHHHLGRGCVFDGWTATPDEIRSAQDRNAVAATIVQPWPGALPDARSVHDDIAKFASDQPGRVFGMASVNPHYGTEAAALEIRRCVRELGFVAVKCHTIGHALNPNGADAQVIFETALDLGVPVMVHIASFGIPLSAPGHLIPLAKRYPDLTIIAAHMGAASLSGDVVWIAEEHPNIVLETSWAMGPDIAWAVQTLGADRVMIGTDHPMNVAVEIAKIRELPLTDEDKALVLGGTAERVFRLAV
ncbi:MAG: amidohydrolase family protein [Dehalococcoidia bacterium]